MFGRLLDPDAGHFWVEPQVDAHYEQYYLPNTNVLVTRVITKDEDEFQVTDFCPRFEQHGRIYRPISFFRIVEPIKGSPKVRINCKPVRGWDKEPARPIRGNSHLRYEIRGGVLHVTTNMSLTYLCEESFFTMKDPIYFSLSWDLGLEGSLIQIATAFLQQTIQYWTTWVKHCSIPTLYQKETIRSALTLKVHCFEDTGAILAALTSSLPEENGSGRNWDYRYCWLRDAYFVLSAFHRLGHFEETEGFLKFLLNIGEKHEQSRLRLRRKF